MKQNMKNYVSKVVKAIMEYQGSDENFFSVEYDGSDYYLVVKNPDYVVNGDPCEMGDPNYVLAIRDDSSRLEAKKSIV